MQYIVDIKEYIDYIMYIIDCIVKYNKGIEMKQVNRIKVARVEKDFTQEQLAEKVGVTRQTIGLIEGNNYNPTLKLCLAIAKALEKSLDDLFYEKEEG